MVLPKNLIALIEKLEEAESTSVGCLKKSELVNRDIKSKYFMPDDLAPYPFFAGRAENCN